MKSLFLISLLIPTFAFAMGGDEKGNGGNLVVCRDSAGKVESTELLDYYEAEARDIPLVKPNQESYPKILKDRLEGLRRINPDRAKDYETRVASFFANTRFHSGVVFVSSEDSFHVFLPRGCAVEQVAVQRKPIFPEDKLFNINKDLWDRMSERDRAGLILHEVIYQELIEAGQKDSMRTRYFNAMIASEKLEKLSEREFHDLAYLVGLKTVNFNEMLIDNTDSIFNADTNAPISFDLLEPHVYKGAGFEGCLGTGSVHFTGESLDRASLCKGNSQELNLKGKGIEYKIHFDALDQKPNFSIGSFEKGTQFQISTNSEISYSVEIITSKETWRIKTSTTQLNLPYAEENAGPISRIANVNYYETSRFEISDSVCGSLKNPKYDNGKLIGFDDCANGSFIFELNAFKIRVPVTQLSGNQKSGYLLVPKESVTLTLGKDRITFLAGKPLKYFYNGDRLKVAGTPTAPILVSLPTGGNLEFSAGEEVVWNTDRFTLGHLAKPYEGRFADGTPAQFAAGDTIEVDDLGRIDWIQKNSGSISFHTEAGHFEAKILTFREGELYGAVLAKKAELKVTKKDETCLVFGVWGCLDTPKIVTRTFYTDYEIQFDKLTGYVTNY